MPFLTELSYRNTIVPGEYELLAELVYQGKVDVFRAPQGFRTDLASVPRFAWSIFPPTGDHEPAAVIHDYLYTYRPVTKATHKPITRAAADGVFRRIMREQKVGLLTRWTMWAGTRIGGWWYWKQRHG